MVTSTYIICLSLIILLLSKIYYYNQTYNMSIFNIVKENVDFVDWPLFAILVFPVSKVIFSGMD